jgi:hypothetical protein
MGGWALLPDTREKHEASFIVFGLVLSAQI